MAPAKNHFKYGLCSCFDEMPLCCYGCWCPCLLFGDVHEKVHGGDKCAPASLYCLLAYALPIIISFPCHCFLAGPVREKVRHKYNLDPVPCSDCCLHCWCSECALCQEYRQLRDVPLPAVEMTAATGGMPPVTGVPVQPQVVQRPLHGQVATEPPMPGKMA